MFALDGYTSRYPSFVHMLHEHRVTRSLAGSLVRYWTALQWQVASYQTRSSGTLAVVMVGLLCGVGECFMYGTGFLEMAFDGQVYTLCPSLFLGLAICICLDCGSAFCLHKLAEKEKFPVRAVGQKKAGESFRYDTGAS